MQIFGNVICDNLCIICDTDDIKRQCDHLHDLNGMVPGMLYGMHILIS